jgi:hypothetical protein
MGIKFYAPWVCLAFLATSTAQAPSGAESSKGIKLEHPGDVALSEDAPGKFIYKSFPSLLRLYVYDKDSPGKSTCGAGCATAWLPLRVSSEEKNAVGDWTIIVRDDGMRQWAYKNRPVYTRYHDLDPDPSTEKEGFHLLKP